MHRLKQWHLPCCHRRHPGLWSAAGADAAIDGVPLSPSCREKVVPEATAWFTGEALLEYEVGGNQIHVPLPIRKLPSMMMPNTRQAGVRCGAPCLGAFLLLRAGSCRLAPPYRHAALESRSYDSA